MQNLQSMIKRIPQNPDSRVFIIGTTSNYAGMKTIGMDQCFNLKLRMNALEQDEIKNVLKHDIGINHVPIKKLVEFQNAIKGKRKELWTDIWAKFT